MGKSEIKPRIEVNGLTIHIPAKSRTDDTLFKALGRAHHWRQLIETGKCRSITDLAEQEKISDPYVIRILGLTLLAPDITEAILFGKQPKGLKLSMLLRNMPLDWDSQHQKFETVPPA